MSPVLAAQVEKYLATRCKPGRGMAGLIAGRYTYGKSRAQAVQVSNNDYLCVDSLKGIRQAQAAALAGSGEFSQLFRSAVFDIGVKASTAHQDSIECLFADYLGKEYAYIGQSGFAINEGVASVLCSKSLPVYIDHGAHASFWPGIRFSKWKSLHVFSHNDAGHLARLLARNGPGIIFVESIYSGDGSIAPLLAIAKLAEGSTLVIDESHSLGMYGPDGAGLAVQLGLNKQANVVITASLSKAFATRAGLVAASKDLILYIVQNAFPAIFSSALLEHEQVRLCSLVRWMRGEEAEQRRKRLRDLCRRLRGAVSDPPGPLQAGPGLAKPPAHLLYPIWNAGPFQGGPDPEDQLDWSPILAVRCHSEEDLQAIRDHFESGGSARDGRDPQGSPAGPGDSARVYGSPFFHPATPRRYPTYRLSMHSALTDQDLATIQGLLERCASLRRHPLLPLPAPVKRDTLRPKELAAASARQALWYRVQDGVVIVLAAMVLILALTLLA